jgi:asparagine synthase (glutamine-hydrolysing)
MCGIAGLVREDRGAHPELLDRMVRSMWRRGPDGEGRFERGPAAIGMRRLAILDPAGGQQPFATPDGRYVAMLNGEIYNHRALRRELAAWGVAFETTCDAEVLPHAFAAWGADGFARRLDGMFGIVVLDTRERVLHLFRDRYGEKPVFYAATAEGFAFASQLATMTLVPGFDFAVDPIALRHYLFLHYVPGGRTIFAGVRRLEPGMRLELSWDAPAEPRIGRWVDDEAPLPAVPAVYGAAVRDVRRRLERAVSSRLISDVPICVFLSGGLDSSAVAAAAARRVPRLRTFSVGFEDAELDESAYSQAVASHLGADHRHYRFDLSACLAVLDDAMASLDEPIGDPACLPVLLLSREARREVTVVLTGEGADEFFGGYGYYPDLGLLADPPAGDARRARPGRWRRWLERRRASDLAPGRVEGFFRPDNSTPSGFPGLTNAAERDRLVPGTRSDEDAWSLALAESLSRIDCPLRRAQAADIASWLDGDLLPKLDRMSMSASLEGRAPFLDPALAEYALALPAAWKIDARGRKRVLRDAVSGWLPAAVLERRKQGFVLPIQAWLQGPLRERLLDGLDGDRGDGLDARVARELAEADLACGASRARLLYGLLAYREWMEALRKGRAQAIQLAEGGTS